MPLRFKNGHGFIAVIHLLAMIIFFNGGENIFPMSRATVLTDSSLLLTNT